jgi:hypothetical protein
VVSVFADAQRAPPMMRFREPNARFVRTIGFG